MDLEKPYYNVPREVVRLALRKNGVGEWLVRLVMATYERTVSVVRTAVGDTEEFEVGVGVPQGSALSPLQFVLVIDEVTTSLRRGLARDLCSRMIWS